MRQFASRLPAARRRIHAHGVAPAAALNDAPADPATAPARPAVNGWPASLRQRLLAAAVLIPIAIALVWFGGWIAFAGAVLTLLLATFELRAMCAHRGWYPLIPLALALGLDFLVAAMLPAYREPLVALGISAFLVGTFGWLMLTRPTIERTVIDWALTIAIPFYVGWPLACALVLRGNTSGYGARGFWWVLALFLIVWANDSAAFITGHFFGRTKLASHVSPAKTWEGFAGGLLLSVVAAFVATRPLAIPWYHALALGILTSIAATIGDLAESLLKRGTGVKDSGAIIPGHGGILDRIDSLLFGVLVVLFYAAFLQGIVR